jgi:hypothetical protein
MKQVLLNKVESNTFFIWSIIVCEFFILLYLVFRFLSLYRGSLSVSLSQSKGGEGVRESVNMRV